MKTKFYLCSLLIIILKISSILIISFLFPVKCSGQTDTSICDNGGFESNFLYYFGEDAYYDGGSDSCTPTYFNIPVTWNSSTLPEFRRFEIVNSGVDSLVGIAKTKFGDKSALINNRYGHSSPICQGHHDVNKLIKRFKVTEENRDFTVWYAAVLENPAFHVNSQPFFSIKCDLAPESDLCFDASIISCENEYNDSICIYSEIDAINWTCHRIKIPKNKVDSIATLEVIAADCGCGEHFGYAYIDGICEVCEGSALGSIQLYDDINCNNETGIIYSSCDGDVITVCGTYTLPKVCGNWGIDSIKAPGFTISNLDINEGDSTFCFDLNISNFPEDSCRELYVVAYFSSNLSNTSQPSSNSIEICHEDFEKYSVDVTRGICQDNETDELLSDDYYYVRVVLSANCSDSWTMTRQLDDPYPDESGSYIIKTGTGPDTIDLGPILIQEGNWDLTVNINGCIFVNSITPPAFCSGCDKFYRTMISNLSCDDHGTVSTSDDSWTFDIKVLGDPTKYYTIDPSSTQYYYNSNYTISAGLIGLECISIELRDGVINNCISNLIVCPPKPCSENCEIESYVQDVKCEIEEEEEVFYAYLNLIGAGLAYYCYESFAISDPGNTGNENYYTGSFSDPLGPFTEDVYVIFYLCSSSACTCDKTCFKILYIPKPECDSLSYRIKGPGNRIINLSDDLMVIPNPVYRNEFIISSNIEGTDFEILSSSGNIIQVGKLIKGEQRIKMEIPSGVYFIRYKSGQGIIKYKKVIKQ